jgi:lipopolysaccharide/colanic/teichoic acid biosynthesis glycosyltransferase
MFSILVKKFIDYILILISSPIIITSFILIALLIYILDGNPVIFTQERGGHRGKKFKILKFATMKDIYDKYGRILPDNKRITSIGKVLRNYSLDELPTLINILKGDMTLVGPRPLISEYLPKYNLTQMRRHDVLPGITGWAQINGRNSISWEEKFKLDLWYVDNHNLLLDIKIIFLTIMKVIKKDNIDFEENLTMPVFSGSKKDEKK